MTNIPSPPSNDAVAVAVSTIKSSSRPNRLPRYFYTVVCGMLLVFTFWGFHHFYTQGKAYPGRPIAPAAKTMIVTHAISMTLWMVLFFAQPLLIALKRHKVHMLMGKIGAVLATLIVVLGIMTGIHAVKATGPEMFIWGITYKQFLSVPILSIVGFGVYVALGVWKRRKPQFHRAMMLLATLSAMSAAISRIDALSNLYIGTIWMHAFGPFLFTLVFGAVIIPAKWLLTGKPDRIYNIGFATLVAMSLFIWQIATTPVWDTVADFLLR